MHTWSANIQYLGLLAQRQTGQQPDMCYMCDKLQDYLTLDDPTSIYDMSSIDMAFTNAYNNTRDFAMRTFNLTEDQAITAITTVMDFAVTQVVDGMPLSLPISDVACRSPGFVSSMCM